MLPFQRKPGRRDHFDTSGYPDLIVPRYDDYMKAYWTLDEYTMAGTGGETFYDSVNSYDLTGTAEDTDGIRGKCIWHDLSSISSPLADMDARASSSDTDLHLPDKWAISLWFKYTTPTPQPGNAGTQSCLVQEDGSWFVYIMNLNTDRYGLWAQFTNPDGTSGSPMKVPAPSGWTWDWHHMFICRDVYKEVHVGLDGLCFSFPDESPDSIHASLGTFALCKPSSQCSPLYVDEVSYWTNLDIPGPFHAARLCSALYNGGDGIFWNGTEWVETV